MFSIGFAVSTREFSFREPLSIGWTEGQGEGSSEILQSGLNTVFAERYKRCRRNRDSWGASDAGPNN